MIRCVALVLLIALAPTSRAQDAEGLELVSQAERALDAGRPVDALRALRKARDEAGDADAGELAAAVATGFGELYSALAQVDRAKDYFRKALPLTEALGGLRLAKVLNGMAQIDLLGTRYATAGALLERAQALEVTDPRTRSRTLQLASELQARFGDLEAADRLASAADEAAQDVEIARLRARAQKARIAVRRVEYRAAFDAWVSVLEGFDRVGARADSGDAALNLGDLLFRLGLVEDSKPRFEEAHRAFSGFGDLVGEARALVRLSRVEQRLKRPDLALSHADAALGAARKRHDYVTEAEALVELGEIWVGDPVPEMLNLPNPDVAQRHLKAAREIYRDAGDRGSAATVWLRTGAILLRAKKFRTATLVFATAAKTAEEIGDETLLWQSLRGQALAAAGQDDLAGAAARMARAIELLERVYARTAGLSQEARSSFLGDRRGIYEEYVEILIRLQAGARDPALERKIFEISEQARSRQFTEMLAAGGLERAAASAGPRLRELVARERLVRADLNQLARALAAPNAQSQEGAAVSTRIGTLRQAHEEILRTIRADFPRYAELLNPRATSLRELQTVLRRGEALLSYFVGSNLVVAFVVTRESAKMFTLELPRKELRLLVDRFRGPFADLRSVNDLLRWRPADAHALYQRVVAPLVSALPAKAMLIIAGDDALYTLPFEALLRASPRASASASASSGPAFKQMATYAWFGDRHAIAYVPSAGVLRALRQGRTARTWSTALVAFADPDFGSAESGAETRGAVGLTIGPARAARGVALARLPETADEARTVSRLVGGRSNIHMRADASEARATESDLSGTRYLLFSTHGLLGGEVSAVAEPSLALAMVGNPEGVDGFLSMSEVLALRLSADLVVLSACNTAGEPGAARIGEGFAGLTRSFMYAGATSLVVSHWPVGSQATVALMSAFFEALAAGQSKPVALATARKRLRSTVRDGVQFAHPFFWAPFVLVGDVR